MKRKYLFLPIDSNEIFSYLLPGHAVNFYIKFVLYKNVSSKLYTNPVLLLMFTRLHVMTLSVNQCVLISQRNKKINFGEEINNQCYTCYVDVVVRNVTFVQCSKDIFS